MPEYHLPQVHLFTSSIWHREEMWNELSNFKKNEVVHYYEIVVKPWWKGSRA